MAQQGLGWKIRFRISNINSGAAVGARKISGKASVWKYYYSPLAEAGNITQHNKAIGTSSKAPEAEDKTTKTNKTTITRTKRQHTGRITPSAEIRGILYLLILQARAHKSLIILLAHLSGGILSKGGWSGWQLFQQTNERMNEFAARQVVAIISCT